MIKKYSFKIIVAIGAQLYQFYLVLINKKEFDPKFSGSKDAPEEIEAPIA